jgi:hypothetical protein
MRTFAVAAVLIAAVSNVEGGQTGRVEVSLPPVFTGVAQPIEPPGQTGAWVLQVISRGGLDGRGTGDLTIKSDGTATLVTPVKGAASIHPDTLVSLNQRIRSVATPRWAVSSRLGICSDCTATLIVLSIREPNGLVSTYTAFWDATTTASIPEDLRRIHDLALTIRQR